ncbi:MAG: right-handed parallel beta-helix repeat-containing protein [Marinoscillum sp.]
MKTNLYYFLFINTFFLNLFANAQCGCDLILHDRQVGDGLQSLDFAGMPDSTSSYYLSNDSTGWVELLKPYAQVVDTSGVVLPGTQVCLGQIIRRLYLENVKGDSLDPIIIKNYPGEVAEISAETTYAGLQIHNSSYFEIRGDCNLPDSVYGIYLHGINSNGVEVSGMSERFLIHKVKVDTAGTGVKVKDNRDGFFANCQEASVQAPTDSTWYASDITISNTYLANLKNEGIYMNNTSYKFDYNCDVNKTYFAYEMDGVHMLDNIIINTGKDGIQATGVVRDCIVRGNQILNVGTDGYASHGNGIQFGEGCSGEVSNNWVEKTSGVGIFSAGLGTIDIYQNVVLQTATDGIRAHAGTAICTSSCKYSNPPAFFGLSNYYDLERLSIFNNTIAYTAGFGVNIEASMTDVKMERVYVNNNIITEWGAEAMDFISSETANYDGFMHAGNNVIYQHIGSIGFMDSTLNPSGAYGVSGTMDVRLTAQSPANDNGIGLLWTDDSLEDYIGYDFDGNDRVQQSRIDCGAFESGYELPSTLIYQSTEDCDCALPKEVYGFDGAEIGAGYKICLLDSARAGRIWFQNLEGTPGSPVIISAVEELSIAMSYHSNAMSFKDCSGIAVTGKQITITASNPNYAKIEFSVGNTGSALISNLVITGSDDLIDIAHGYGTNLMDSVTIDDVKLESVGPGNNLIRIKGKPGYVVLKNVKAESSELNQTLMNVNLAGGGNLGIYNSIFDGFDTDASMHKWIQVSMKSEEGSTEANSVKLINNTFVNLANTNTGSTSNFRILHRVGTGSVDSLILVNNAINKSSITDSLTAGNYKNSANQISTFTANHETILNNYSTQYVGSLALDSGYVPGEGSPLFNSGLDVNGSIVRYTDYFGHVRPDTVYHLVDIGAVELQPTETSSSRQGSFGFEELHQEEEIFEVYPNPVSDVLKVKGLTNGSYVIITDEKGKSVVKEQVNSDDVFIVRTDSWYQGVYHIRLVQGAGSYYGHVVVKH